MAEAEYGAVEIRMEGYEDVGYHEDEERELKEEETPSSRRAGCSWAVVALGIVILFRVRSRTEEVQGGDVRSLVGDSNTLGMFFWAFLFTAMVPVIEVSIDGIKGLRAGSTKLEMMQVTTFDPLDALILATYLFAMMYRGWKSPLSWVGTVMCLFCSALGPLGQLVTWPTAMKPIQAFRAVFGYIGMILILFTTLIRAYLEHDAYVVALITITAFFLTILFQVVNCAVAWFVKYSPNLKEYWAHVSDGGIGHCCTSLWCGCCPGHEEEEYVVGLHALEAFSENDLDELHQQASDPLDKLLCMMYLFCESASGGHDVIVLIAVLGGLTSSVLNMLSRYVLPNLDEESVLYKVVHFRGAIGLGAVALVTMNAIFLESPPTWSALTFVLTAIIPFFTAARWLITNVKKKPGEKQLSTADLAKSEVSLGRLQEADKRFLSEFDELDQLLLTMYLFASTSPGTLVWIGCLIGLFASSVRILAKKTSALRSPKVRGAIGSVAVITIITTTLVAHFGY